MSMLYFRTVFASLLTLLMAVQASCSDSHKLSPNTYVLKYDEEGKPELTMTLCVVYAGPKEPKFPRAEVTRALEFFIDKYPKSMDAKFYNQVAALLEKSPAGRALETAINLLQLKCPLDGALNLLEKLPAELAPQGLNLLVKQGSYASLLLATLTKLNQKQLAPVVTKLLKWPEGAVQASLVASYQLIQKHGPTLKNEQLREFLTDVSFMLMKPLDARGHERAQVMMKFESHIFFSFLKMSRPLPSSGQHQDLMIGILSQLHPSLKQVVRGRQSNDSNAQQPDHPDQVEWVPSGTPEALAETHALNQFSKALFGASKDQVATSFKMVPGIINGLSKTIKVDAVKKLGFLTHWLSVPEDRMGTVLETLNALGKKNPNILIYMVDTIQVIKQFPLEEIDQYAEKLVYFCWGSFEKVIQPLVKLPVKHANLIVEKTYDFCQKRDVPMGSPEQIILSALKLREGRVSTTLDATDNIFTTFEQTEPRLKELFASNYASVLTALGGVPKDRLDSITQVAIQIMGRAYKGLSFHNDYGTFGFNPAKVIDYLRQAKKEGLQAALETSLEFCADNNLSDWYCAEIIKALSWVKPERMKAVIEAFEKIYKKDFNDLPTEHVISQLGKLPIERMDEFVLAVQQVMTSYQDEELNQDQVSHILSSIVYVPPDQVEEFVTSSIEFFTEEDEEDSDEDEEDNFASSLVRHATSLDEAGRAKLFQLWTLLLSSEDIDHAEKLCEFITDNVMELGLHEEHPMVQLAIRVQSVLDNDEEDSPYVIYERLKQKRLEPIDWAALRPIKGGEEGLYVSLNHQGLAKFGSSIVMDLKSVPKVDATDFVAMVDRLKAILAADLQRSITPQLKSSKVLDLDDAAKSKAPLLLQAALMTRSSNEVELIARHEAGIIEEEGSDKEAELQRLQAETVDGALQRLGKDFLNILDRAKAPTSVMIKLMNSPVDSIEASRLKCVVNHLMHITDEGMKIQRMCQFFAGVQNCNMGQNTAIQDYYVQLPDEYRIRTQGGIFECSTTELPAMQALYRVVETLVSSRFSPESVFMKEICGIKAHEEIMEAAHQINCMKGLIVHLLGSQHGLKFDLNADLIYENILNMPLQKMMQMFYEHVELGPIVAVVKLSFDTLIKAEADREAKPIYVALNKIHDSYAKKDTFESWLEYKELEDDVTYVPDGITNRGVMRLMQRAGILDEIDAALPW